MGYSRQSTAEAWLAEKQQEARDANENAPGSAEPPAELVDEARANVIGLTNEAGDLVDLLAGVTDDDLDDLLVETSGFQAMLARARASIQAGRLVSASGS